MHRSLLSAVLSLSVLLLGFLLGVAPAWAQTPIETEVAKLLASDGAASEIFGDAVAVAGDTAVIGARGDDFGRGAAYVFTRSGTTWTEQAKLVASDGMEDDLLGLAVAVAGDTAVIGAPQDDDHSADSGSAYVFDLVPSPLGVRIDIKPGSTDNPIDPRSTDVIPVAILTTDTFDATDVDPLTVAFGPNGAVEAHQRGHIQDANKDGRPDLVLHFNTQATGIQRGDTSASLTGETFEGQEIEGADAIKTVNCR